MTPKTIATIISPFLEVTNFKTKGIKSFPIPPLKKPPELPPEDAPLLSSILELFLFPFHFIILSLKKINLLFIF